MGQIEKEVLEEEEINLENLRINAYQGSAAKAACERRSLQSEISSCKDMQFRGKGCQAVEASCCQRLLCNRALREIMKPSDPIAAGF